MLKACVFLIPLILFQVFQPLQGVTLSKADSLKNAIRQSVKEPSFPARRFKITDFGAKPGYSKPATQAINKAIELCSSSGGGIVIVPAGTYISGPIYLKSNVNLHLEKNAIIRFSTCPEDYLPLVRTRWEGIDCYNYSPLIYAFKEKNIAITGEGILDGQADTSNWWKWKGKPEYGWKKGMPSQLDSAGRPRLLKLNEQETNPEVRSFGEGGYLRPPFIQFYECSGILIEDITIRNSPFWLIHPLLSENIIIRKIHAISHGPNNDGIDPESCRDVIIYDCYFDTGDDCIAIKSGRDHDGRKWNRMSENILITNCRMKNGHGGVSIGSEVSGGCKNVVVDSCKMDSPELERALRIKTNSLRGGIIENIYFSNIAVGEVKESVLDIDCQYEMKNGSSGLFPPVIRNIFLTNITSRKSRYALFLRGIPGYISLDEIVINNSSFHGVQKGNYLENTGNIRLEKVYINGSEFSLPATSYHKTP